MNPERRRGPGPQRVIGFSRQGRRIEKHTRGVLRSEEEGENFRVCVSVCVCVFGFVEFSGKIPVIPRGESEESIEQQQNGDSSWLLQ